jgi:hypothetical protein
MHARIDFLEKQVRTLIQQRTEFSEPPATTRGSISRRSIGYDSPSAEVPGTPDRVELEDDATRYTNSGHWRSILDGITELRDELDRIATTNQPRDSMEPEVSGPDLLFGGQRHATKGEILSAVPPRAEVDELIESYFSTLDLASTTVHKPTFMREVSLPLTSIRRDFYSVDNHSTSLYRMQKMDAPL